MLLVKGYYWTFYGFVYMLIAVCVIARWLQAPNFAWLSRLHDKYDSSPDAVRWLKAFSKHPAQDVAHFMDKSLGKAK